MKKKNLRKGMATSGQRYFNEHENNVLQNILLSAVFILTFLYMKQ